MGRGQGTTTGTGSAGRRPGELELPQVLRSALASTASGHTQQGVYLACPTRQAVKDLAIPVTRAIDSPQEDVIPRLQVDSYFCTQRTTAKDLAHQLSILPTPPSAAVDANDPQGMEFPDVPSCFVLKSADLLPNETWRFLLQVMKTCNRKEYPLLIVAMGKERRLLSRLCGLDGDSSMMWQTADVQSA